MAKPSSYPRRVVSLYVLDIMSPNIDANRNADPALSEHSACGHSSKQVPLDFRAILHIWDAAVTHDHSRRSNGEDRSKAADRRYRMRKYAY